MTASAAPPTALVTGASRGIGLAIAVALSRAGYRVARTARNDMGLRDTRDQLADPDATMAVISDLRAADAPAHIL
ncbi:MAG: SDR family NAD(P)-dependent oxidoreductase, partial [Planctomycetota bacterium]